MAPPPAGPSPPGPAVGTSPPAFAYGGKEPTTTAKDVWVPNFPRIQQLPTWKVAMVRSLAAASPYHDKQEVAWFKEIENATFEELGRDTSARFQPLDAQLAAALIKTLPEQLRVRVQAKEMEAYKNDATITGRQIVHVMYDWLRTDAHMSTFFSVHDLSQATWLGGKPADMEKFMQSWDHILEHMQYTMPPDCLRDLFFRMIEKSFVLREDCLLYTSDAADE